MINLVVRGTCLINEKVKMNYNCRKFKIVSFPPQSKQIHDPRLGKEGLCGRRGGGRKGTLGSCQQGSMAKLLYATLVLFQIENVVIFFTLNQTPLTGLYSISQTQQ